MWAHINDITINTKDKNNPRWITHKVLVLQRPQIFTAHSQANLTVIKGMEWSSTTLMENNINFYIEHFYNTCCKSNRYINSYIYASRLFHLVLKESDECLGWALS